MRCDTTLFLNAKIYTPGEIIEKGCMLVSGDGKIEAVGGAELSPKPEWNVRDLHGLSVLPGFIDVHIHGGGGFGVMDAVYDSLDGISRFHARNGTTSFLATTTTAPHEDIVLALQNASDCFEKGLTGAELLGVHLEGPFINTKRRGAQDPEYIQLHNDEVLAQYLQASGNRIRLVTLAPETGGGWRAVEMLVKRGIAVSIGHSDATYEQVVKAVELGATHTTHHFNGMSSLHHREPGVAGAGLILSGLTTELIADGVHVHAAVVKLLFDIKGERNVCLITDAISCAGMPDGEYEHVKVINGSVYLKDGSSLAGSTLTTIRSLKNVLAYTGYKLEKILPSLTLVPARQIGIDHRKGSLAAGKDADFLIVDDDLCIQATYVKGNEVYAKDI